MVCDYSRINVGFNQTYIIILTMYRGSYGKGIWLFLDLSKRKIYIETVIHVWYIPLYVIELNHYDYFS